MSQLHRGHEGRPPGLDRDGREPRGWPHGADSWLQRARHRRAAHGQGMTGIEITILHFITHSRYNSFLNFLTLQPKTFRGFNKFNVSNFKVVCRPNGLELKLNFRFEVILLLYTPGDITISTNSSTRPERW